MKTTLLEITKLIRESILDEIGRGEEDIIRYIDALIKKYGEKDPRFVPDLEAIKGAMSAGKYQNAMRQLRFLLNTDKGSEHLNHLYPIVAFIRDKEEGDETFMSESVEDMRGDLMQLVKKYSNNPSLKNQVKTIKLIAQKLDGDFETRDYTSNDTGFKPLAPDEDRSKLFTPKVVPKNALAALNLVDELSVQYSKNPSPDSNQKIKILNKIGDELESGNIDAAKSLAANLRKGNSKDKEVAKAILSI